MSHAPQRQQVSSRGRRKSRRGIAALWVILITPAFLLLLCFVSDIGKLWLARLELENALEASALAGVKQWGEAAGGPTLAARGVAMEYAGANTVGGVSLGLLSNYDPGDSPNENEFPTGNLVFGSASPLGTEWAFNPSLAPDCNASRHFAVRAQASVAVTSLFDGFLGLSIGPYSVTTKATAVFDCNNLSPRVVISN